MVLNRLSKSSFNGMVEAEPSGSGPKSEWEEMKWRWHKQIIFLISLVVKGQRREKTFSYKWKTGFRGEIQVFLR